MARKMKLFEAPRIESWPSSSSAAFCVLLINLHTNRKGESQDYRFGGHS